MWILFFSMSRLLPSFLEKCLISALLSIFAVARERREERGRKWQRGIRRLGQISTWNRWNLTLLTTNFFSTYQDFSNFRHETRERRKRVNGICWNQTSVKWVNLVRNSLQLKNKYSRPIPNYAFNVFQEYDLFDRMTILILKL